MALYLVLHEPREAGTNDPVRLPTRLLELAKSSLTGGASPRWLKTWSPDLHDDRVFSLWEAERATDIEAVLTEFGFLDDLRATPLRVREWGPTDVVAAETA